MKHLIATLALCCAALPAVADEAWDLVPGQLFGDRVLRDGSRVVDIDAPYRTPEDARASLAAQIQATDGARIDRVRLVLDNNPIPVSAIFDLATPQTGFFFDVTMRVNGPAPMHVIAETSDGPVFVTKTFVKTSGQGACAAPPGTDPDAALATLGEMTISVAGARPGSAPGHSPALPRGCAGRMWTFPIHRIRACR